MLSYKVTLEDTTSREKIRHTEEVSITDTGHPVQNNIAAIEAARLGAAKTIAGVSWTPVRVEPI